MLPESYSQRETIYVIAESNPTGGSSGKRDLDLIESTLTTYDYGAIDEHLNFTYPSSSTSHLRQVRLYIASVVMPVIFAFGILGNIANLLLLTSRRLYPHRRQATPMERSAIIGLKNLALSDLLFCLVGFPKPFVRYSRSTQAPEAFLLLAAYYTTYNAAFMNIFLFSSTWLIALVCTERYIAVCHPFRAAALIRVRRTVLAHLMVFVFSALLNIPLFLSVSVARVPIDEKRTSFTYIPQYPQHNSTHSFQAHAHYVAWFALGTFTPLSCILVSNALIIRELYRKSSVGDCDGGACCMMGCGGRQQPIHAPPSDKGSTMRLTLTLVCVVVCFLILVCPSTFLHFSKYIDDDRRSRDSGRLGLTEAYFWALAITNLTQALKFSSNFILYSAINKTFRQTFARLVRGDGCRTGKHLPQQQQQQQNQQLSKDKQQTTVAVDKQSPLQQISQPQQSQPQLSHPDVDIVTPL